MSGTLFSNVMVFDGSGAESFPGEVLVRGERIEAVARGDERLPREGATVVEGHGRTLMPGMVEAHGHLTWPTSVERVINTMKPLPIEQHVLVTAQNARITLDHGFTSVYSADSLGERIEPALRDMIDAGFLPGPRLRASALEKGAEGVLGVPAGHDPTHRRDIPHLREYIAQKAAEGCDTIKFLMSTDDAFQPGGSQTLMYSEEEAQAIGAAARDAGIWLACHAQGAEAVKRALRAGFRAIYHCTHADEEALDLFEARRCRCAARARARLWLQDNLGAEAARPVRRWIWLPVLLEGRPSLRNFRRGPARHRAPRAKRSPRRSATSSCIRPATTRRSRSSRTCWVSD